MAAMRNDALAIFHAGVEAADPGHAVNEHLRTDGRQIIIDSASTHDGSFRRAGAWSKIHLIAFGKAACGMAKTAREIIPDALRADSGIAVTNYENTVPLAGIEVIGAGHPLPDESGYRAARLIAARILAAQENELVLILISGGGSALIPYPVEGVALSEKCKVTELLLESGATIQQINCVRKHLSRIKGGNLAKLCFPADCHALILSDVLDDDVSAIASGPTVPDPTTFADAVAIIRNRHLWSRIPDTVRHHLERGVLGMMPETPKPNEPLFDTTGWTLIGSNRISLNRALQTARGRGYDALVYSDRLCGIASEAAEAMAIAAKSRIDHPLPPAGPLNDPIALLAGGETTVQVKGGGRGGRNQEMALAFALAAEKHRLPGPWVFLSGGTDGRDGPTDAAGGIVDSDSIHRMRSSGVVPEALLANNDSYRALEISRDLLTTGATGTNVADLQILLIDCQN
ncbi:MAG: glycerate kinase type-2 family protein [Gammaproteobacteria bacterium]